jgi:hypothetical protein
MLGSDDILVEYSLIYIMRKEDIYATKQLQAFGSVNMSFYLLVKPILLYMSIKTHIHFYKNL